MHVYTRIYLDTNEHTHACMHKCMHTYPLKSCGSPQSGEGVFLGGMGDVHLGYTMCTSGRDTLGVKVILPAKLSIGRPKSKVCGTMPIDEWHQGNMMLQTVSLRHLAEPCYIPRLTPVMGGYAGVDLFVPPSSPVHLWIKKRNSKK